MKSVHGRSSTCVNSRPCSTLRRMHFHTQQRGYDHYALTLEVCSTLVVWAYGLSQCKYDHLQGVLSFYSAHVSEAGVICQTRFNSLEAQRIRAALPALSTCWVSLELGGVLSCWSSWTVCWGDPFQPKEDSILATTRNLQEGASCGGFLLIRGGAGGRG